MPILSGKLQSVGGAPFGGPGCAVLIYSRITRPGPGNSMILKLQDRIGMPAENDGIFTSLLMPSGPVRVMLEGNDVHGQAWDITLPEGEETLQLTDLVETQIDWSPVVVSRVALLRDEVVAARNEALDAVGSTAWAGDVLTVNGASSPPLTGPQGPEGPQGEVSTAQLEAGLAGKADLVGGQVPTSQIPAVALTRPIQVADTAGMLAADAQEGDVVVVASGPDQGTWMATGGDLSQLSGWVHLTTPDAPVSSVNGQTGAVTLGAGDVGAAPAAHTHTAADTGAVKAATAGLELWSGNQAQYDSLPTATRTAAGFVAVII